MRNQIDIRPYTRQFYWGNGFRLTLALEEALLERFDCILTLKNGGITEAGTFRELMGKKGYFYSLFTVAQ